MTKTAIGTRMMPALGALLVLTLIALVISGVRPHDRVTWVLETLPVMIAIPILVVTRRVFPLTP